MKKYNAVIIGSGTGGSAIAGEFAKRNNSVLIIEDEMDQFGGACINFACVPTKALLEFSKRDLSYERAVEQKDELTKKLQDGKYDALDKQDTIRIRHGEARFNGNKEVEIVSNGESDIVSGEHIIINTGSKTFLPPIDGIHEAKRIYTSTTLMEEKNLPKELIIIGGGYIGLEFATIYANFGSNVTVITPESELVPQEERKVAEKISETLNEKGVTFIFDTKADKVTETGEHMKVHLSNGNSVSGDAVLVATGRKPNTEKLQLDKTDIKVNDDGAIEVNDRLESTVNQVWAVGDVKGGMQYTYISSDDARIVTNQIFGDQSYTAIDRKHIPYSVFVDPPLSRVGLTKKAAIDKGYEVATNEILVSSILRALLLEETTGLFTSVVDKSSGRILGVSLYGSGSEEMINIVKIAMDEDWRYTDLRDHIFNHPVMSESLNNLFSITR